MSFVTEIESHCGRSLSYVDIGGGLSSSYTAPNEPAGFAYSFYRKELETVVPALFSGKYQVITEYGRSLLLKVTIDRCMTRLPY